MRDYFLLIKWGDDKKRYGRQTGVDKEMFEELRQQLIAKGKDV